MADTKADYYVPHGSPWPIVASVSMFVMALGGALWLNGSDAGRTVLLLGLAGLTFMMFGWLGTVIRENIAGLYSGWVDRSFRQGMAWFIFSEVMFFVGFFGALFYARVLAVPWLGGDGIGEATNSLLWSGFESEWPTNGPGEIGGDAEGGFQTIGWSGLPLLNTALLLTSSVTITIAHHALKTNNRRLLNIGTLLTIVLGAVFLYVQAYEYVHAYQDLDLRLSTGIYGSTFFMLTGFHGAHVTLGVIMLIVTYIRTLRGHFTPNEHFGFQAVSWYWHFVDVVWVCLFIFVYVL